MNNIYRIVWSIARNAWVVCSEISKTHGKKSSAARKLLAAAVLLPASAIAADATLPGGADVTAGQADIVQHGATLNIDQHSQHLATDWQSFNIGSDATVNFNQPDHSAVALNRVVGSDPSRIMGNLNANGQVFLENGNGIVFGKDAQLNVGGLIATTQAITADGDGSYRLNGNSFGNITNHGNINAADGGTVALIAPNVINNGSIQANRGNVRLTAANDVTLKLQDGSLSDYRIDRGTLNALVDNGGAVIADGGVVHLTAEGTGAVRRAVLNHSGQIQANRLSKNDKGEIVLLADKQGGSTNVSGSLSAQGQGQADGGFIEASAATVNIADSAAINTQAEHGNAGTFLIDPYDFVIDADKTKGNITGAKLGGLLNNSNVKLETVQDGGTDCKNSSDCRANDNATGTGNLFVNDAVSWNQPHQLTLKANDSIYINKEIKADHADAKVALEYGNDYHIGRDKNAQDTFVGKITFHTDAGGKKNFTTQKGSDSVVEYTVITELGAQGDENDATKNTLQALNDDSKMTENFVLGADIDASATSGWNGGTGFKQLGTSTPFQGILDGLGHKIENLNINRPTEDFVGLFAYPQNAELRNLSLTNVDIKGAYGVGGVGGFLYIGNTVNNVHVSGNLNGTFNVGGLTGSNVDSDIKNSSAAVNIQSTGSIVGGLAGENDPDSKIINSHSSGEINADIASAGGLVGFNKGTIIHSNSDVNVFATQGSGGLTGPNEGTIQDSYSTGNVELNKAASIYDAFIAGGLVSQNFTGGKILNSYSTGSVKGFREIGGLVGDNRGEIENSFSTGKPTGEINVGGLVGFANATSVINNSITTAQVDTTPTGVRFGGLVGGIASGATIKDSYWNIEVNPTLKTCDNTTNPLCNTTAGKSEAQLKQAGTYSGWDTTIWDIQNGAYPTLSNTNVGAQTTISPKPQFSAPVKSSSGGNPAGSSSNNSGGIYNPPALTPKPKAKDNAGGQICFAATATHPRKCFDL